MTENKRLDEDKLKSYLIKIVKVYRDPAPTCSIVSNTREFFYSNFVFAEDIGITFCVESKEGKWVPLCRSLNDNLISRLLEELASEGKIIKEGDGLYRK